MKKIIAFGFILVSLSFNAVTNAEAVEWAPFVKVEGITQAQLIQAAQHVQVDFIEKQKGFIRRELVKKNDSEYADIIHWRSKADVFVAAEEVKTCEACNAYFKLMELAAETHTGSGWSVYEVLESW
jgi:hypothetical protein